MSKGKWVISDEAIAEIAAHEKRQWAESKLRYIDKDSARDLAFRTRFVCRQGDKFVIQDEQYGTLVALTEDVFAAWEKGSMERAGMKVY